MSLSEVCAALYNYELRRKDKKEATHGATKALIVRDCSQNQKKGRRGRSSSKPRPNKDECAFCREKGHWKKDCPKLKAKGKSDKGKAVSNVAKVDDDNSDLSLVLTSSTSYSGAWLLDSGCSHHMCPNRDWFFDFQELDRGVVYTANDTPCETTGVGTIHLRNHDGSTRILTDVRYVPSLTQNLISVGTLESKGLKVTAENGVMKVISGALVLMKGIRKKNNLYYYQGNAVIGRTATVASDDNRDTEVTKLWHMRLGHAGVKSLQILAKQGLLEGVKTCKLDFCEHCVKGKQTRMKFGTAIHDTKGILDYVHSDVWGPSKTASMGGKHYYVTFVDDYSRRVWVYSLKKKDEVLGCFLNWKNMVETQTGRRIKRLRTDNGGEYRNDPFDKICQDEGIVRHFTVRDTPQQNGVAERMNRTLLEKVRCMLSNAGLGRQFWAEAVTYASHLINRLPSTAICGKTPFEVWSGKPANDYNSLHIFGSTVYYHVKESKLDPRAKKALFMGITSGIKGYRLWCPESKKIIFSRNVTFDEFAMLKKVTDEIVQQLDDAPQQVENTPKQVEFERIIDPTINIKSSGDTPAAKESSDEEEVPTQEPPQQ